MGEAGTLSYFLCSSGSGEDYKGGTTSKEGVPTLIAAYLAVSYSTSHGLVYYLNSY
jgi:hypothetical protein